jgi:hypothetical protein
MVDKSPEAAKTRGQAAADAAAAKTAKQRAKEQKHLAQLREDFGEVGKDNGRYTVGTDQYKNLILYYNKYDEKTGQLLDTYEVYFFVQPDGRTWDILSGSSAIKRVKELYKGNLENLRKQLFDKNFINETDYVTKDETAFNQGIVNAVRNYSLTEVQKYTIEGQTEFKTFGNWISGLGSAPKDKDLPLRDINLVDRDIVEAIVKDIYSNNTDMAIDNDFLKQETDRYMKKIEKGTLTTVVEKGGEAVRTTTPGFSRELVAAELPERITEFRPGATNYKTNFDFLAFLNSLGAPVI